MSPLPAVGGASRAEEAARERAFALSQIPRARHAVVVFGFGVPDRPTPTIELKRRLAGAIAELDDDPEAIAIVSGDAVHSDENEADVMKQWLVDHGIAADRIVTERTARLTSENASFVAPLLAKAGVEKVSLLTERYHMNRSKLLLRRALAAEGLGDVSIKTLPAPDEHRGLHRVSIFERELTALGRDLLRWQGNREAQRFLTRPLGVPVFPLDDASETAKRVAEEIAAVIREKHDSGGAVLGLATGSTPLAVYRELIRMHHEEGLDFSRVKTFNLDEYYGLSPDDPQSYHHYMQERLFSKLDVPGLGIDPENVHIPRGDVPPEKIAEEVKGYEQAIQDAGGIDLQLLGIGATGHIGFNEPGSTRDSRTRRVTLADQTREDAAAAFGGLEHVPTEAITMGVATILSARRVLLMATGEHKASVVRRAIEGEVTDQIPATFLNRHPNVEVYLDRAAAKHLAQALPAEYRPRGREGTVHEAIFGERVLLPAGDGTFVSKAALIVIEDGTITHVVPDPKRLPREVRRVKGLLAPGFVDLQNNGSYGDDVAGDPIAALRTLVLRTPEQGVTTVLPTVVSAPLDVVKAAFDAVDRVEGLPGADVPGLHVEGPYLNRARRGAHSSEQVRPIDLRELESMIEAGDGRLRILTLAPELPGALEAIRMSREHGVTPSAGHTNATGEEMERALAGELRMITHITNAMPKDLDGDLLTAILDHPETVAGVIPDGVHVEPERLRDLYRRLGPQRMMLVTDASPPAGMPDGKYTLGDIAVEKKDGAITVEGTNTLAGSALTMDRAIVSTMRMLGIEAEDAVLMASSTPAKAAGLSERGEIVPGRRADFVILDPKTLEVRETIVGGVTRYDAAGGRLRTVPRPIA